MSSEETNPTAVEETTQGGGEITNTQEVRETPSSEESSPAGSEESQETKSLEQIQRERDELEKKVRDLNKGFTESSQRAAERERENEQLRHALGSFVQQQQVNNDPIAAAEARYQEALETYDPTRIMEATRQLRQVERQQIKQEAIAEAIRLSQAATQAQQVQQQYGYDVNTLAEFHRGMTPELIAKAKLIQEGRYDEIALKERQEKERRAKEAQAIGRLVGTGTPGAVPGGFEPQDQKVIDDVRFLLYPRKKQDEMIADGWKVVNNKGEVQNF